MYQCSLKLSDGFLNLFLGKTKGGAELKKKAELFHIGMLCHDRTLVGLSIDLLEICRSLESS